MARLARLYLALNKQHARLQTMAPFTRSKALHSLKPQAKANDTPLPNIAFTTPGDAGSLPAPLATTLAPKLFTLVRCVVLWSYVNKRTPQTKFNV